MRGPFFLPPMFGSSCKGWQVDDVHRPHHGFSLIELLVALAVIGVLVVLTASVLPGLKQRADRADALARLRTMGHATLLYVPDHGGRLPPLFPGQVLEFEEGRGGRIVTECADYLGLGGREGSFLVTHLMPRTYARLTEPADKSTMRVFVMNTTVTTGDSILNPFGRVVTGGQPPVGTLPLSALVEASGTWMISTADQTQPAVAAAPWRANAPEDPPLGDRRAVFRFDGSAGLVEVEQ